MQETCGKLAPSPQPISHGFLHSNRLFSLPEKKDALAQDRHTWTNQGCRCDTITTDASRALGLRKAELPSGRSGLGARNGPSTPGPLVGSQIGTSWGQSKIERWRYLLQSPSGGAGGGESPEAPAGGAGARHREAIACACLRLCPCHEGSLTMQFRGRTSGLH